MPPRGTVTAVNPEAREPDDNAPTVTRLDAVVSPDNVVMEATDVVEPSILSEFKLEKLVFIVERESRRVSVAAIVVMVLPKFSIPGPNFSIKDRGR